MNDMEALMRWGTVITEKERRRLLIKPLNWEKSIDGDWISPVIHGWFKIMDNRVRDGVWWYLCLEGEGESVKKGKAGSVEQAKIVVQKVWEDMLVEYLV